MPTFSGMHPECKMKVACIHNLVRQSWVTLTHCVFLNKVLIIQPNATYRSSTIVLVYTATCFGFPDQSYRIHRMKHKGREACLYGAMNCPVLF